MASKLWSGGQSTAPDINLLKQAFGKVPEIGRTITYEEIETVINIARPDYPTPGNRWYTIIGAWKRYLETVNIRLKTLRTIGYRVMDPHDRTEFCSATFNSGIKKLKTVAKVATGTDVTELSQEEVVLLEHYQRTSMALLSSGSNASKDAKAKLAGIEKDKALTE